MDGRAARPQDHTIVDPRPRHASGSRLLILYKGYKMSQVPRESVYWTNRRSLASFCIARLRVALVSCCVVLWSTSFFSFAFFLLDHALPQVTDHMLDLWAAGEKDMLDEHNQYRLSNTGQGLQRVQVGVTLFVLLLVATVAQYVLFSVLWWLHVGIDLILCRNTSAGLRYGPPL